MGDCISFEVVFACVFICVFMCVSFFPRCLHLKDDFIGWDDAHLPKRSTKTRTNQSIKQRKITNKNKAKQHRTPTTCRVSLCLRQSNTTPPCSLRHKHHTTSTTPQASQPPPPSSPRTLLFFFSSCSITRLGRRGAASLPQFGAP